MKIKHGLGMGILLLACGSALAAATAVDDASQSAYDGGWTNGINGGSGFGAWTLVADQGSGYAGHFNAGTNSNSTLNYIQTGPDGEAWGLYANGDGVNVAAGFRELIPGHGLYDGYSFTIDMENGYIAGGGSAGFTLRNSLATNSAAAYTNAPRFHFGFTGGSNNYFIIDGTSGGSQFDTGIGFTLNGLRVRFTLAAGDTYDLEVIRLGPGGTTNTFLGRTMQNSGQIMSVALYADNVDVGGADGNVYFNSLGLQGITHYVSTNGLHQTPFTNWVMAATNIQAAVDFAGDFSTVLVSNGTYDSGGKLTPGADSLTSRVVIAKTITVQSVNGPSNTFIVGAADPTSTNGPAAVRCVFMTNSSLLIGFTLTNGHTRYWFSGITEFDESGGGVLAPDGVLSNCIISGNTAALGGGSYGGTLNHCTLSGNSAIYGGVSDGDGGGSAYGTLNNCTLSDNYAYSEGGGSYYGALNNCTLSGNSAHAGGGSDGGTLNNCTLSGNTAGYGGGSYDGALNNCTLTGNSAYGGGGSDRGTLNNCTLSGNSATFGGGSCEGTLNNCIVYYNTATLAEDNRSWGTYNYCCTTPDAAEGTGNITNAPMLLNASHIHASSPCVGAGSTSYVSSVDIDGDAWATPPAIGCDQPAGPYTGNLAVSIQAAQTNIAVGFSLGLHAVIMGDPSSNRWTFGDGDSQANSAYVWKSWNQPGAFAVVCSAYNDDNPGGISATVGIHVVDTSIFHVWTNSPDPNPPYQDWQHAAHTIQEAVDESACVWGSLVLVTDGVYRTGGRVIPGYSLTNRVVITHPVTVQSVNGPSNTFIVGAADPVTTNGTNAIRCVYMANNSVLIGFTLTNGHTRTSSGGDDDESGGGVLAPDGVISNCVLTGNSADWYGGGSRWGTLNHCMLSGNSARYGGGSYYGTLNHCTLSGNSAKSRGGGSYYGTLNHCTLSGNTAGFGGGSYIGTLTNCTLSGNTATFGGGSFEGVLYDCTFSGNTAERDGGGSFNCTLNNCTLSGNSAETNGGGSCYGTLTDCALTGNFAVDGDGGGSYGSALDRCILSGNGAMNYGGGCYSGTVTRSTLSGNSAKYGGGCAYVTPTNCVISHNTASSSGGGSYYCDYLWNCTIVSNSAPDGGGDANGSLYNCILYYNTPGNAYGSVFFYSCTYPQPPGGEGNITNAPQFVDMASSNFHLAYGSPCIDSGTNLAPAVTNDIEGTARPLDGNFDGTNTFDMGAYEYNPSASDADSDGLSDGDEVYVTGTSPTNVNTDGDCHTDYQEWIASTDGSDSNSYFRLTRVAATNSCAVWFACTNSRAYSLYCTTNLPAAAWSAVVGKTNQPGEVDGDMALIDTNTAGHCAYHVGVSMP